MTYCFLKWPIDFSDNRSYDLWCLVPRMIPGESHSILSVDDTISTITSIDCILSPFPKDSIEFVTLWCRYVCASLKLWSVNLRDFPQPMVDVQNKHVWGRLIGAEREGTARGVLGRSLFMCIRLKALFSIYIVPQSSHQTL